MSEHDELAAAPALGVSTAHPLMGAEAGCAGAGGPEPPRKRARAGSEGALRRRILEAELLRLRALRERFTEQLSELYFLQAGGNMMDYGAWRKRPPAPQLLAFLEARRPPAVAPALAAAPALALAPADEMVEKARQEAYVAGRVAELARAGLWPERRLPRVLDPPRAKSHWDYLLEEMAWLAQDFAHERKWKKQAAKKCARAVQKHFQDRALAAQRAEKARELHLRKIAAFAAKEIRTFWSNVEKLVEWKRVRRVERARKEALDEQLSYIVDRTERYSRALAAGLARPAAPDTPPSDDEFTPRGASSDDEETIAAAERDRRAELRAGGAEDDESTIAEQERAESADHAAELAALRADADLSLDELRRRYATADDDGASSDASASSSASASSGGSAPLEALVRPRSRSPDERRVERAANLAAALQPTGTTLSETAVATPVPALLRHALREYQHVGLHWLATMYARGLNGILADEMGLGKTVQTIALLAHLALERNDWGPHLVVAPTSVVLNWEMEFKKWCPAFKILTYYGTIKERKLKRVGWTKANSFHVCITSYKLVVQDHQSFRRKRWKYLVLDEAQNIKNFKSQRWQLLLNFQTERRLLLTGTPLQNSLLELWSLMHFLMPDVFASHSEFREWFGEVTDIADGSQRYNEALVRRLHAVLRPFLLRRLKADVERQMPRKYEHVLMCRLSKRQRFLYDDFMARAKTRESLASGNLLSVINVLMQLRKVCNHPDLFESRPVSSPLQLAALRVRAPALALEAGVAERAALAARLGGDLAALEARAAGAFAAHRARHLAPPRRLVEELAEPARAPRPPRAELRLHLRLVPRAPPPAAAPPAPAPAAPPRAPAAAAASSAPGAAAARLAARRRAALRRLAAANERRCWRLPLYGADLRAAVSVAPPPLPPRDIADVLREMDDVIDRFTVCWRAAVAPAAELVAGGGARGWRRRAAAADAAVAPAARQLLALLHAPAARQAVAFPHPSLLQYDCGKLQTLAVLLRRLRAGGHRVLIFTQMTRVLDVLEAFLSLHGHAYLRLDGATRVERRQALVERFNADARVFAFILSTRSGGVGLNLTGADCVVFYDSDWNPTMDAQAQDRCHRIGQTRDVHVYRLVSRATVEENILRKADQKRALGHLAIEHGHFTTSALQGASVEELFGAACGARGAADADGAGGGALESALAAAEDEADAAAAAAARAEHGADLAEFDESVPLDEAPPPRPEDADDLAALMHQLSPVERYAMRAVEGGEAACAAERAALGDMRRQLREWERARAALEPARPATPPATYPRAQMWVDSADDAAPPAWCPPTPPQGDGDVYCESWARALYRAGAAHEALLPAAARRERAAAPRAARPRAHAPRAHHAPLSLFERAGAPRARARARPAPAPHPAPAPQPEWTGAEDAALRRALRLQRLPPDPPPPRAPNWDWAAELVGEPARAYRSPRACRERHDALADPERARRRHRRPPPPRRRPSGEPPRPPLHRLDAVRDAAERRRAAPRRRPDDAPPRNPMHAAILADHGVEYDAPPSPMEVASRRAERIAREKLKAAPAPGAPAPAPRIVVAAAEPRGRGARGSAPLLYRQQPFPARHLKILQQAPPHAHQSGSGAAGEAGALRKLQLQQLALRRAAPLPAPPAAAPPGGAPAPPPPGAPPGVAPPPAPHAVVPHVVVAHVAPRAPPDTVRQ